MDKVYRVVTALTQAVFASRGIKVTVWGVENLPSAGPALLASNHLSYLDFLFAGYAPWVYSRRYTRFMAKKAPFDHKIGGPLMRAMQHIPVDRADGQAALRLAIEYLQRGELVAIFPEGTMSESFEIQDFKTGAARIALATKVPIIPIAIWGSQRIYCDKKRDFSRSKIPVIVNIGSPLYPNGTEEELTDALRASISALLAEAQKDYPAAQGAWWVPARLGGSAPTVAEVLELRQQRKLLQNHLSGKSSS